jgi:HTH-type transcriptional regulator/antitoxin HigA
MDARLIAEIDSHFQALSSVIPLRTILTEEDYDKAVDVLNQLLDAGLRRRIMHSLDSYKRLEQ